MLEKGIKIYLVLGQSSNGVITSSAKTRVLNFDISYNKLGISVLSAHRKPNKSNSIAQNISTRKLKEQD